MALGESSSFGLVLPHKLMFGPGNLNRLPRLIDDLVECKAKVLLVTGQASLRASGVFQRVTELLRSYDIAVFDEVCAAPPPSIAEACLKECRSQKCNVVVAIGGGSALDIGKMTAVLAGNHGTVQDFLREGAPIVGPGLPCIAVPTTSGSSGEVSPYSVLWDKANNEKLGLGHSFLMPDVALVDPELALSMPSGLAAVTGMDAFTSAFEAYWSTDANPVADVLALEAIRLFSQGLEQSCADGVYEARAKCALGATLSGIAYSSAHTNACHAFGTPLTLRFGVNHGAAVGITLVPFLRWNLSLIEEKLDLLLQATGCATFEELTSQLDDLMVRIGLPTRLSQLGVELDDIPSIAKEGLAQPQLKFMPRSMDHGEAEALLHGIF